jgi:hypothetical protein
VGEETAFDLAIEAKKTFETQDKEMVTILYCTQSP